ncbi:MAG: hypothetical protein PHN89_05795 [Candidatus Pacebacteria bacterium]|nr:hypothetical protein [Candidatus Paceibacterota bacterium]
METQKNEEIELCDECGCPKNDHDEDCSQRDAETAEEHEAPEEHESALMTAEDRFISEGTKDHEYHF